MLEEQATVVRVEPGVVWVQTTLKTTCGNCQAKESCGTSAIASAFTTKPNVIAVHTDRIIQVGDQVVIGVEQEFVIKSALLVYLLPIAGFMLFAFLSQLLFEPNQLNELITTAIAFVGGWLGYWFAKTKISRMECGKANPLSINLLTQRYSKPPSGE